LSKVLVLSEKKYNEGNFLNQTTLLYPVLLRALLHTVWMEKREKRVRAAVCVMAQQHRRNKLTQQQRRQNNKIAETIITYKPI